MPAIQAVLLRVNGRLLPEASATVAPVPSLNFHAPTTPVGYAPVPPPAGAFTVTFTAALVVLAPALSVATAVILWLPIVVAVEVTQLNA